MIKDISNMFYFILQGYQIVWVVCFPAFFNVFIYRAFADIFLTDRTEFVLDTSLQMMLEIVIVYTLSTTWTIDFSCFYF